MRRLIPLFILALGAAVYFAYGAWLRTRPYEWSGTVEARTIVVGSRIGGRVRELQAREGERVDAGAPLLVLETGDLDAQRRGAVGQLAQAEAAVEKAKKGARPEEIEQARARAQTASAAFEEAKVGARSEQVAGARARLVAVQVAVDKAQLDADRTHKLFSAQAVSQAEVDGVEAALRGATAQKDAAKQALDELENGSRREEIQQAAARAIEAQANAKLVLAGSRVEDIKAAEGALAAARGRLEQIKVMQDELVVKAPRAARIETLDLRPGDILAPNAAAATLLEDDELFVRIYVPETRVGLIHPGDTVPVFVDSFPDRPFKGTVERVAMQGEYSPRNLQTADERANQVFAARVGLGDGKGALRAGMAAFIRVVH
jgi:multidrug resistance efflux pump